MNALIYVYSAKEDSVLDMLIVFISVKLVIISSPQINSSQVDVKRLRWEDSKNKIIDQSLLWCRSLVKWSMKAGSQNARLDQRRCTMSG